MTTTFKRPDGTEAVLEDQQILPNHERLVDVHPEKSPNCCYAHSQAWSMIDAIIRDWRSPGAVADDILLEMIDGEVTFDSTKKAMAIKRRRDALREARLVRQITE